MLDPVERVRSPKPSKDCEHDDDYRACARQFQAFAGGRRYSSGLPTEPDPVPQKVRPHNSGTKEKSPANNSFLGLENEVSPVAATIAALASAFATRGTRRCRLLYEAAWKANLVEE